MTLIRCPVQPRVTALARKRSRSFCKKNRWQVASKHAYTIYPLWMDWADYGSVQAECGNVSANELTVNSSGNTPSQSSHLPERLCRKSGLISVRKLMSTLNRRNSRMLGINCRTSSESNRKRGKSHQHPTTGKCPGRYLATKQYFRLHLSA